MWGFAFLLVAFGVVFFYLFMLFTLDFFTELNNIFHHYIPPPPPKYRTYCPPPPPEYYLQRELVNSIENEMKHAHKNSKVHLK